MRKANVILNISLVMAGLLIIPLLANVVSASEVIVSLYPAHIESYSGEIFELSIRVKPGSYGVSGGEVVISFNPQQFKILDVEVGDLFGADPLVGIKEIDETNGIVRCAIARKGKTTPPTPEGTFITVKFRIRDDASPGEYEIRIEKVGLADESFRDIPQSEISITNAEVYVKQPGATTTTTIKTSMTTSITTRTSMTTSLTTETSTVTMTPEMTSAVFSVVDLLNRPILGFTVSIEGGPCSKIIISDNKVVVTGIDKDLIYEVLVEYRSPHYGTTTAARYVGPLEQLQVVTLPIGGVSITIIDAKGRPVGGAVVKFGRRESKTDSEGRTLFRAVPLEDETGRPIKYEVKVTAPGGLTIAKSITTSTSMQNFTITFPLGDLNIVVIEADGQPVSGALVKLSHGGVIVKEGVSDEKGSLTFTQVPPSTYTIQVSWRDHESEKEVTVSEEDIFTYRTITVEVSLPIKGEGHPIENSSVLALALVIVIILVVSSCILLLKIKKSKANRKIEWNDMSKSKTIEWNYLQVVSEFNEG